MSNRTYQVSWPQGIKYEIFVQSYADSNGDGIGDIPGMTSKLDYLQELRVNGIWLMPINPSPSYHKYDVVDYKGIHPDYGTLDDFKTFVEEAHRRGIKVIMDLIVNHTSSDHPWFKESRSSVNSPYRDYYVWRMKDDILEEIEKKEVTMDSDNITQWHQNEQDDSEELFYGFFHGGMPDLNFDNPKVRQEIFDIGKFWLEDIGVDGFRLDAAKHIYPDDRAEDNHAWWVEFRTEMQKYNPDVYLVGEVWADAETVAPFLKGLPSLFNFDLAFSLLATAQEGRSISAEISGPNWIEIEGENLLSGFIETRNKYLDVNPNFQDAIFLSNHDQNRSLSFLNGDVKKAKLAASLMFTLPGLPYIYYGEEIGMLGQKPDPNIREPFLWDIREADQQRATWIEPRFSTDTTVTPLAVQMKDRSSLYMHYKHWISLRNQSKALSEGSIESLEMDTQEVVAFRRKTDNETLMVYHNLSQQEKILNAPENKDKVFYATMGSELQNGKIRLLPFGSLILK